MSSRSSLQPGKPVSAEVDAYLDRYRPQWPEEHLCLWEGPVGEAAIRWVRYAGPPTADIAKGLLNPVGKFALWSFLTRDSIDEEELWKPQVVDQWVHIVNREASKAWQQTARAQLRRVGPLVGTRGGWPVIEASSSRRGRAVPYTHQEEAAYEIAAFSARGATRDRKLLVLACSFGAGLFGGRLANLRADDVIELDGGRLALEVPSADGATLIPVRARYTAMLREAVEELGPGQLLVSEGDVKNLVNRVSSGIRVHGVGPLKVRRARATWLRHHIVNETPLPTLWSIAGPLSGSTIEELLQFVPAADESTWLKALDA